MRRRGRDLEAEILRAGREVFSRLGYDKVRVEDILEEAGVSRHSFYRFFESKHDVLMRLTESVMGELVEGLSAAAAGPGDPATKVRHAIELYLRWMRDLGRFQRVLESQEAIPGSPQEAIRRATVTGIRQLLQREALPVVGASANDDVLVAALIGAIEGVGRHMVEQPETPDQVERLTEICLIILWRSLAPPDLPDPTR